MKRFFSLLSLLIVTVNAKENISLFAEYNQKQVELYWEVVSWPDNVVGFKVSKKNKSSWNFLANGVIRPHFAQKRDCEAQGYDKSDEAALNQKLNKYYLEGKISGLSAEESLARILKYKKTGSGFRIKCRLDKYYSIFTGFAAIDKQGKSDDVYGLHAVYSDGKVSDQPLASGKVLDPNQVLKISPLYKIDKDGELIFQWNISDQTFQDKHLLDLSFYQNGELIESERTSAPIASEGYSFAYKLKLDSSADQNFAVSAKTFFGNSFTEQEFNFDHKKYLKPEAPKWTNIEVLDGEVILHWMNDIQNVQSIKSVSIFRRHRGKEKIIVKGLAPQVVKFHDKIEDPNLGYMSYTIELETYNGDKISSQSKNVTYNDPSWPDYVKGLKAQFNPKTMCVDLTWDKGTKKTTGYRIWADPDEVGKLKDSSAVGTITENSYSYPIGQNYYLNRENRIHTYMVVPIGDTFAIEKRAAKVSIELPLLFIGNVTITSLEAVKDQNFKLKWEMPEKHVNRIQDDVSAFELQILLRDDKREYIVHETVEVSGDKNEFIYETPANIDGKAVYGLFRIWAKNKYSKSEMFSGRHFHLKRRRMNKALKAPENFKVSIIRSEGKEDQYELEWDKGDKGLQCFVSWTSLEKEDGSFKWSGYPFEDKKLIEKRRDSFPKKKMIFKVCFYDPKTEVKGQEAEYTLELE